MLSERARTAAGIHADRGCRCSFRPVLVDVDIRLVDHRADEEGRLAGFGGVDAGEVSCRAEGAWHSGRGEQLTQLGARVDREAR